MDALQLRLHGLDVYFQKGGQLGHRPSYDQALQDFDVRRRKVQRLGDRFPGRLAEKTRLLG